MAKPNTETTTVAKGVLYPSKSDVTKIVKTLQTNVKTDKKLATQLKKDPRAVLGALGINEDVQAELLHDAGVVSLRGGCQYTCQYSCWFTDCCITRMLPF